MVASKDEITGNTAWKPVVRLFRNHDKAVVKVSLIDADSHVEVIGATTEHPFYVQNRGWVAASALIAGDSLVGVDGKPLTVQQVVADGTHATTYNFEVADTHTYFVGKHGAWVHNSCSNSGGDVNQRPKLSTCQRPLFSTFGVC